jgi:hypothetical protein
LKEAAYQKQLPKHTNIDTDNDQTSQPPTNTANDDNDNDDDDDDDDNNNDQRQPTNNRRRTWKQRWKRLSKKSRVMLMTRQAF